MGREIVYCGNCGDRLLESDFKRGHAVTVQTNNYCRKCAKGLKQVSVAGAPGRKGELDTPVPRETKLQKTPVADRLKGASGWLGIPPSYIAIGIGTLIAIIILLLVVGILRGR